MEAAEFREEIAKIPAKKNTWIRNDEGKITGIVFRGSDPLSNGMAIYLLTSGIMTVWFTGAVQSPYQPGDLDLYYKDERVATVNKANISTLEVEE